MTIEPAEEVKVRDKELGERSREELAALFGKMYAGWDRGVNMDGPDTGFRETPMTPLELEARYVAAEIGINIFEIANRAAFAPVIVYSLIQKYLGPVYAALSPAAAAIVATTAVEGGPQKEQPMDVNSSEAALWSENMRLKSQLEHLRAMALPFAAHDWMDAELEDDNCKLTKHSGPITVGHWRALRKAVEEREANGSTPQQVQRGSPNSSSVDTAWLRQHGQHDWYVSGHILVDAANELDRLRASPAEWPSEEEAYGAFCKGIRDALDGGNLDIYRVGVRAVLALRRPAGEG